MKKVCVLGAGSWGTAMATVLAENGHHVKLWCREQEVAESIQKNHCNQRYLPGIQLSSLIIPTTNLQDALCGVEYVFEAIPIKFLRSILEQTKSCFSQDQIFVILSKGIEQETLLLPSQIIDDVYGFKVKKAIVSGPSYARNVAQKEITAVTVAAQECEIAASVQKLLENSYFRPYISLDIVGVQVGAALKNVIALAIGVLDGAGYKDNVKSYVLTRGLQEMVTITKVLGGTQETLYGLAGVGDLVLTSMGSLSKNVALGRQLGQGISLQELAKTVPTMPEGVNTVQSINKLIKKYNLVLPICQGVFEVIFNNQKIDEFTKQLMQNPASLDCI